MELQSLLDNPNATSSQIATSLKQDPLLAAQVFKAVHLKIKDQKVDSLAHAISLLGLSYVKDIILIAGLGTLKLKTSLFDPDRFWTESFLVGQTTEYLAKHFQQPLHPDHAYIAGSVCNIGKIVLAACVPEQADKNIKLIADTGAPCSWTEAEEKQKGYQHTVLGEIGAVMWGLPAPVINIIAYHHKIASRTPIESIRTYETVGFANQLTHFLREEPHRSDRKLLADYCMRFHLSEDQLQRLLERLRADSPPKAA
jgi:HD-like signal output (HDOD) protein